MPHASSAAATASPSFSASPSNTRQSAFSNGSFPFRAAPRAPRRPSEPARRVRIPRARLPCPGPARTRRPEWARRRLNKSFNRPRKRGSTSSIASIQLSANFASTVSVVQRPRVLLRGGNRVVLGVIRILPVRALRRGNSRAPTGRISASWKQCSRRSP